MKKKVLIGVLSAVMLIGSATVALGATDTTKLTDLHNQMFSIKAQIIDQQVLDGTLTQEQADAIKQNIELHKQSIEDGTFTPGQGMLEGGMLTNMQGLKGRGMLRGVIHRQGMLTEGTQRQGMMTRGMQGQFNVQN